LAQTVASTEAGEIAQARPCGLSRLSRGDHGLNGAWESDGHGQRGRATRTVIEIIAATAASARGWAERLIEQRIPAGRIPGSSDRTKINRRSAGFRLACEVLVLVVAVGKRERNVVDQHADQR
jgi:hypothetical protein